MLHLISQASANQTLLQRTATGDCLVFFGDAVFRLMSDTGFALALAGEMNRVRVYALLPDLETRGVEASEIPPGITLIGYDQLVALTVEEPVIQSWR
ncbi:MAG: sulfurtransferase complex subunit TusB [Methylobacter sp.]|nr:MAG: sulfurtransferase complex subunit TusB [Methylobacter sp.]